MSVNRLVSIYHTTPPETLQAGRQWYPKALEACETIAKSYDIPASIVVAVVSILSPNSKWETNLDDAATVIENVYAERYPNEYAVTTYNRNKYKAHDLVESYRQGASHCSVCGGVKFAETGDCQLECNVRVYVTGDKVSAFYAAILGDVDALVLDSHCINAFVGRRIAGSGLGWTPVSIVRAARKGYIRSALVCGETTRDFQAIIWTRHIERIKLGRVPGYSRVSSL